MATTAASYRNSQAAANLPRTIPRFDADFIERRLREHREWQQRQAAQDATEIIMEVSAAIVEEARMRAGKGPNKIARLK